VRPPSRIRWAGLVFPSNSEESLLGGHGPVPAQSLGAAASRPAVSSNLLLARLRSSAALWVPVGLRDPVVTHLVLQSGDPCRQCVTGWQISLPMGPDEGTCPRSWMEWQEARPRPSGPGPAEYLPYRVRAICQRRSGWPRNMCPDQPQQSQHQWLLWLPVASSYTSENCRWKRLGEPLSSNPAMMGQPDRDASTHCTHFKNRAAVVPSTAGGLLSPAGSRARPPEAIPCCLKQCSGFGAANITEIRQTDKPITPESRQPGWNIGRARLERTGMFALPRGCRVPKHSLSSSQPRVTCVACRRKQQAQDSARVEQHRNAL